MSVGAYIHDFEELDRQALSAADSSPRTRSGQLGDDRADHAREALIRRDRGGAARPKTAITSPAEREKERGLNSDELFERGRKAEAAGRTGVALAFYRQARDRGSADAGRELDRLQKSRR